MFQRPWWQDHTGQLVTCRFVRHVGRPLTNEIRITWSMSYSLHVTATPPAIGCLSDWMCLSESVTTFNLERFTWAMCCADIKGPLNTILMRSSSFAPGRRRQNQL